MSGEMTSSSHSSAQLLEMSHCKCSKLTANNRLGLQIESQRFGGATPSQLLGGSVVASRINQNPSLKGEWYPTAGMSLNIPVALPRVCLPMTTKGVQTLCGPSRHWTGQDRTGSDSAPTHVRWQGCCCCCLHTHPQFPLLKVPPPGKKEDNYRQPVV